MIAQTFQVHVTITELPHHAALLYLRRACVLVSQRERITDKYRTDWLKATILLK